MHSEKERHAGKDWFAKELEREREISAWDLDERKTVRKYREEGYNDSSDPFFVIDLILFSLLLPFNALIPGHSLFPVFLLFVFLLPGLILWEVLLKRFPPTWYFILALILTIVSEAVTITGFRVL
jgi:hypothetical protein